MKNYYLFIAFLMFGFGFGQNPADIDPTFNQFNLPQNNYYVENARILKLSPDGKIIILENGKLIKINGNLQDTSFNTGTGFSRSDGNTNTVSDFAFQQDGKVIVTGYFDNFNGTLVNKIVRLNVNGSLDISFNSGNVGAGQNTYLTKVMVQSDDKIVVQSEYAGGFYNGFGFNYILKLNSNGTRDINFNVDAVLTNSTINNFFLKSEGKLLLCTSQNQLNNLFLLNVDGTVDTNFSNSLNFSYFPLKDVAYQNDGKIVLTGTFVKINNVNSKNVVRVNVDGTLDSTFVPAGYTDIGFSIGGGAIRIAIQPDQKIILTGNLRAGSVNNIEKEGIVRLNTNGTRDDTFLVTHGFKEGPTNNLLLPDGKIVIANGGGRYNTIPYNSIIKLNSNGTIDPTFNNICKGFNDKVRIVQSSTNGKIYVAGNFNFYNNKKVTALARLNFDGSTDNAFTMQNSVFNTGIYNSANSFVIQPDSKIIVAGSFFIGNSAPYIRTIMRLNSSGTLDTTFNVGEGFTDSSGYSSYVRKLLLLPDGSVLATGSFSQYNLVNCPKIVKLSATGSLVTTFNADLPNILVTNPYYQIIDIALQSDNKILVLFSNDIPSVGSLIRLNADGSRDLTFNNFVSNNLYSEIILQQDGKIFIYGRSNNSTLTIIKLLANGAIDLSFDINLSASFPNLSVDSNYSVALQIDGKIYVSCNGLLSRFNNDGSIDTTYPQTNSLAEKLFILPDGKIYMGGKIKFNSGNALDQQPFKNLIRLYGQDFNFVQGQNKLDTNTNGCDINDISFRNLKLNISSGSLSESYVANETGNFKAAVPNGNYTVTPILENPSYFNVSPSLLNVNFPTQTSPQIQDFCITPNGTHSDLEISLLPINAARPGFDAKYKLVYKNKGNQLESGTINLIFNDSVLDIVSANPVVSTQSLNSFSWNFTNLNPSETREITIVLNLNTPMETPALNGGSILNYAATATSLQTDETPSNNTFAFNQTVVNSFDPNDKTCLQGLNVGTSVIGDYVHYVIRFENTGNYAAQNITIKDVIDTNKFDVSTLIPLSGSALFTTKITDVNKVEFLFENINLPFLAATNTGYVAFKIKTKSTLTTGDTFGGLANIFFDYNFPITTNTYTTTIQALSSKIFSIDESVNVYPNPTSSLININANNNVKSIELYDVQGRIIQTVLNSNNLDLSEKTKGIYFLKITTEKGSKIEKVVKE